MVMKFKKSKKGSIAVDQVLVIAASIIVVGLILIPGMKELGTLIMGQLDSWWDGLSLTIFTV
jgi:hypothetical protein